MLEFKRLASKRLGIGAAALLAAVAAGTLAGWQ